MEVDSSKNARMKRKLIIKCRKENKMRIVSDENRSPSSTTISISEPGLKVSNRTPLSSLVNDQENTIRFKNLSTPTPLCFHENIQQRNLEISDKSKSCSSCIVSNKYVRLSDSMLEVIGRRNLASDFDNVTVYNEDELIPSSHYADEPRRSNIQNDLFEKANNQDCVSFGQPCIQCEYCNAELWFEERVGKNKISKDLKFSLCCQKGKVQLPLLRRPPDVLLNLMSGQDKRSKHFKDNLRAYNNMFAFTSIGGKVDCSRNDGGGPPQFILNGQNYHRIGTLLPEDGTKPKFAQLYIYDTQNELQNRMAHFRNVKGHDSLDPTLIEDLTAMMDKFNSLAKNFRMVRDFVDNNCSTNFVLRLFRHRVKDPRVYNVPTADEVAAVIVGDLDTMEFGRDILVRKRSGELQRLHETHTSFIPLQYPLIFPYGEDGFKEDIPYRENRGCSKTKGRFCVTLREWISFRIQERKREYGNVVNAKRLFQQFVVDCYSMVESQRLTFIRFNQKTIRTDLLHGLQEAICRGETNSSSVGKRVILPSSFTGGMRYMFNNCQDAMAICKSYGYPDLFITMTCNTNWSEIKDFVSERGLAPSDRPDIVCRVFKMKLEQLLNDMKKDHLLGKVNAGMYTIEFQKRGLPHAHMVLWFEGDSKLTNASDIDKVISAELPDPADYPKLFEVVSAYMIHGPCGVARMNSPCMKDKKCSKYYPKKFKGSTTIDEDGFPCYRRRDSGVYVMKNSVQLDNRSVVPYSPILLMRFNGHINTEYCNKSNSIKYLFKYVNKGPDRATIQIREPKDDQVKSDSVDEIKRYYDCRYLSPCEAVWRIFAFDIHERWPAVQRLTFHLPRQQPIVFQDDESIEMVLKRNEDAQTMFLAWFEANKNFQSGRDLTYAEFPSKFVFLSKEKIWNPRKQGHSIGRLTYIPPGTGELFYLRLLLTLQRGCIDYESIRTVNGRTYKTFEDACYALGLLANDQEYIDAIKEAAEICSGSQLRRLFATLLFMNTIGKPDIVWNATWKLLSDGILYEKRKLLGVPDLHISDSELQNLCIVELEKLLNNNGRSVSNYHGLPEPDLSYVHLYQNKLIIDQLNFDRAELRELHKSLVQKLTDEQKEVYKVLIDAIYSSSEAFFFLYGYGGTGKTFIWNTLSAALRSEGYIVLNVASSGIASLLLPFGRTAHSTLSIPLLISEESTCNIRQGSMHAKLLIEAKLIIWDEAPMMNRFCFEAFDRTMKDLMRIKDENNKHKPFGGKAVVLGGDFRQILPVVRKGSRDDIVKACINSSKLWESCQVLKLTQNMRLTTAISYDNRVELKEFADWILKIGNGEMDLDDLGEVDIEIPEDILILKDEKPLLSLVDFVYPNLLDNIHSPEYFDQRAILAPTIESYEEVNNLMLSVLPGDAKQYLSSDTVCQSDENYDMEGEWFTTEFLNDIKCSGIPNHCLSLKIGSPIMLLRNLDQSNGLCNGTRLQVKHLGVNVIMATVLTGKSIGETIFIPRMNLIPSDPGFPFKFQRRQFPISLCFAMTINKSQGQSLSRVGLYLPRPVFTHGQLYVAVSRVKSKQGLKILILDDDGCVCRSTKNVVYKEVFDNL